MSKKDKPFEDMPDSEEPEQPSQPEPAKEEDPLAGIDMSSLGELAPGAVPPSELSPEEAKAKAKKEAQSSKADDEAAAVVKEENVEVQDEAGNTVQASQLDLISSQVRQTVVQVLKKLDHASYKKYAAIKYEGCPKGSGKKPGLEQRKKAYLFAFERFLEATYTKPGV